MKKLLVCCLLMVLCTCTYSHTSEPGPGSLIPPFRIAGTDGRYYSSTQIQKNKPFVLIYFAPDCDHCIKLMDDLFKKIHQFDKATIALVTFRPVNDLVWFEKKYGTKRYPNIKVG